MSNRRPLVSGGSFVRLAETNGESLSSSPHKAAQEERASSAWAYIRDDEPPDALRLTIACATRAVASPQGSEWIHDVVVAVVRVALRIVAAVPLVDLVTRE